MRRSLIVSGVGHAIVLGWGLVAFAAKPWHAPAAEPLPVEFISTSDFSQLTAGVKNATATEAPKPLADKTGEPKPAKELAPKVADKPEVTTEAAARPAAAAAKSDPKLPAKVEKTEKPKEAKKSTQLGEQLKKEEAKKPTRPEKKQPEFKPDQIAQELHKEDAKKLRPTPKFDANQVAALLDKREPRRQLAMAETLNGAASLGAPSGNAPHLSQSELDALRARLIQCWSPPPGLNPDSKFFVVLGVQFKRDAFLAHEPAIIQDAAASVGPALAESAKRALLSCQPFTMLRPEHYDLWKYIEIKFNNELLGG